METLDLERSLMNAISDSLNQVVAKFCLNHVVFSECVQVHGSLTFTVDKWELLRIPVDKIFLNVPVEGSNSFYVMNTTTETKQQCSDLVYAKAVNEIKSYSIEGEQTAETNSICSVCFMKFDDVTVMLGHFQDTHGAIIQSVQALDHELIGSVVVKYQPRKRFCRICKKFIPKYAMIHHIQQHKDSKVKRHKCRFCSSVFLFAKSLNKHEYEHHRSKYLTPITKPIPNVNNPQDKSTGANTIDLKIITVPSQSSISEDKTTTPSTGENESTVPITSDFSQEYCVECCLNSNKCKHKNGSTSKVDEKAAKASDESGKTEEPTHQTTACGLCSKVCRTYKALVQHLRIQHQKVEEEPKKKEPEPKYPCSKCDAKFFSKVILEQHDVDEHFGLDTFFSCDICHKRYKDEKRLKDHNRYKHERAAEPGEFECTECHAKYSTKNSLRGHMRYKHKEIYNTNARFKFDFSIPKKATEDNNFQCDLCGIVSKDSAAFRYHYLKHKEMKTDIPCEVKNCTYLAKDYTDENEHLKTAHNKEAAHLCDSCGESFISPLFLRFHRTKYHKKSYVLPKYECPLCKRIFTGKQSVNKHLAWHRGDKDPSVKCEVCGKLVHKSYIATHRRTHTGDHPYKCQYCEKTFMYHNGFARHQRFAHNENNHKYECTLCSRYFVREDRFKVHMAVHEGSLPKLYVRKQPTNDDVIETDVTEVPVHDFEQDIITFPGSEEQLIETGPEYQTVEIDSANGDMPQSILVQVENGARYLISGNTVIQAPDNLQFAEEPKELDTPEVNADNVLALVDYSLG